MTRPSTLRDIARAHRPAPDGNTAPPNSSIEDATFDFEVTTEGDPEPVHVNVAWMRLMRFCRALPKNSIAIVRDKQGKELYRFRYRGVDDVVTFIGIAQRLFGVFIDPHDVKILEHRIGQPSTCRLQVTWRVTSLGDGERFGVSLGEAIDFGDKATVKAWQQAFRTYLTTATSMPTYDPTVDSDASPLVRPAPPTPFELRDEMLNPKITRQRMLAIHGELKDDLGLGSTIVPVKSATGVEVNETLLALNERLGRERRAAAAGE